MSKRRAYAGWPNLFSLFVVTLLATNYFAPLSDLDFSWQIRTGEQIVKTGQLRPIESFSYTIAGTRCPDFEGLYEVVLWLVWSAFGFGGLKLLKTVLVAAPLLLVAWRLRKEGVRWHGIALALVTAVCALSAGWNLRPLYFTTIGLLLVSGWLHDHCTGRRPLSVWLPVVMCLWANLHPGVIAGQGLLIGAITCEWLNRCLKINRPLDISGCWRLTLVGAAGLAATFLSPAPVERLLYPFRPELAESVQRIFVEMQPSYTFLGDAPYTTWAAYALAGLMLVTVVFRFREYRMWELALLLGVTGLANLAARSLQDWVLIMLVLVVPHAAVLLRQLARQRRPSDHARFVVRAIAIGALKLDRKCKQVFLSQAFRFQWIWPVAAFALLTLVSLIPALSQRLPGQNARDWPVAALDWMTAHEIHGRFFGPPDYGSYVCWRLGARARSYVDTRGFFFPAVLIEDSHYLPQMTPGWETRLDRVLAQGTDYFLLESWGARGELWRTLQPHIGEPLYCDERTVLLSTAQVRRALSQLPGAAAAVTQKCEVK